MIPRRVYPGRGGLARRETLRRPALRAPGSIAAAVAALAIVAAISACGTEGPAESAPPGSRRGSADGALPGDSLGPPAPKWRPNGYEIELVPPGTRRLAGAAESLDDLVRTVETALAERDTQRLAELMITEREYREIFYPALPAAHPPIDASFETMWVNHLPDALRGLKEVLGRFGGRDVEIVAVRFERPNQDFVNFALHEGSRVDLVVDGALLEDVPLFGSVFVVDGRWKFLTYPDDGF